MKSTIIRRALPANLSEIQRLNSALFQYEHDSEFTSDEYNLNWPYEAAGIKFFTECLSDDSPHRAAFLAESDGRAVGYLAGSFAKKAFRASQNPIGELDNMFVEPAIRHTGIGAQLFDAFRTWLTQNHVDRVAVGAYAKNTDALTFYRSLGYKDSATILGMSLP